MATMGNLIHQLQRLTAKSLTSTEVQPLIKTAKGHLLGLSYMTAPETILTACTNGFITAFAPGAIVFSLTSGGYASTFIMFNAGTASAPSWKAVMSAYVY